MAGITAQQAAFEAGQDNQAASLPCSTSNNNDSRQFKLSPPRNELGAEHVCLYRAACLAREAHQLDSAMW